MNESVSVRRIPILTLLLALLLGGCGQAAPAEDPPLAGARLGGAFSMTDQNGRRVNEHSWPGKYTLVYFGYTFCPDVCPVDMRVLGAGLRKLEESDPARGAGGGTCVTRVAGSVVSGQWSVASGQWSVVSGQLAA